MNQPFPKPFSKKKKKDLASVFVPTFGFFGVPGIGYLTRTLNSQLFGKAKKTISCSIQVSSNICQISADFLRQVL